MLSMSGILCRAWRCAGWGKANRERAGANPLPAETQERSWDDLTRIRGIGIATQNRLNASGIKSFAQLAKSSVEDLWRILGNRTRGAKVEDWIAQAQRLANRQ